MLQLVSFLDCAWLNEPERWSVDEQGLHVETDDKTDFWRDTHYGFTRDSGHFLGKAVRGGFTAQIHFHAIYSSLYDQAGLMVRTDAEHWLKASAEYQGGGISTLGVVMTDVKSNWSLADFGGNHVYLRVKRLGEVLGVYHSLDGQAWHLMRMGPLPLPDPVQAGVYTCCPIDAGLEARFDYITVSPPDSDKFH